MAKNNQMQICKACYIIPKKTRGCNCCQSALSKFWVKCMKTCAMSFFQCFIFNKFVKFINPVFALSLWWVGCRFTWGKKSYLKQFNIVTQHNKMWKNEGVWRLSIGTVYIYILYKCEKNWGVWRLSIGTVYIYIYIYMWKNWGVWRLSIGTVYIYIYIYILYSIYCLYILRRGSINAS